tara:strand:- start:161 stop:511 length:351 start_codon:yes stop_codon:yes gene_type:complete
MSSYEERMSQKYNFFSSEDKNPVSDLEAENETSEEIIEKVNEENESQEEENMLVPLSAWKKVLDQLGNLHEADKLMAEARERAAKAEAESEFLREKLKNTREELNTFKKKKRFFFF